MKQFIKKLKSVVFLLGTFLAVTTTAFGQKMGEFNFSQASWVSVGGDAPVETGIYNSLIVLDENPYNIRAIYSGDFDLLGRGFTTQWDFLPFTLSEKVTSAGVLNGKIIYPSSLGLHEYQGGIIPGTDAMFQSPYSAKEMAVDIIRKCIWISDETLAQQNLFQYFYETGEIVEVGLPVTWSSTSSMFLDKQTNELYRCNGAGFYKYDEATNSLSEIPELAGAIALGMVPLADGRYIVSYFTAEGEVLRYWNPQTAELGAVLEYGFCVFDIKGTNQYVYWHDQTTDPDQLRLGTLEFGSETVNEFFVSGEPITGAATVFMGFDSNIYAVARDCGLDNNPLGIMSFYGYSAARLDVATSIFSSDETTDVQVYPNPASDHVIVDVENLSGVRVFSLSGQEFSVPTYIGGTNNVDVQNLQSGTYLLRAEKTDGTVGTVLFEKL